MTKRVTKEGYDVTDPAPRGVALTAAEIAKMEPLLGSRGFCYDCREASFGMVINADTGGGDHVVPVYGTGKDWRVG